MKNLFKNSTKRFLISTSLILKAFCLLGILHIGFLDAKAQGDNLGNHTATQNLELNGKSVNDVANISIKPGNSYGIKFWANPQISIKLGNSAGHKYGPVTSFSVKNSINNFAGRGWTWGVFNQEPVAALSNVGTFQLKKDLIVMGKTSIGNVSQPTGFKLYVEEGILTERVKVASVGTSDWADYVFEEDYQLNSIETVAEFVKINKHLPNVPSAKEVNEKGLDMVEMDATLLRQVEELWLQVINLNEEIQNLKLENKILQSGK